MASRRAGCPCWHWTPTGSPRGGITTINRRLCIALAATGARVFCAVPGMTAEEARAAAAVDPRRGWRTTLTIRQLS
ncbi:hypothetical protein AB0M46_34985 [Dactylosporangium sp. NPDC051485]|uniref:hypothetical protein n=1 Tax=Dactylosporangium sp. NPDC051485 TaxID=3154846 RepID=UPI00344A0C9A